MGKRPKSQWDFGGLFPAINFSEFPDVCKFIRQDFVQRGLHETAPASSTSANGSWTEAGWRFFGL